MHHAAGHAAGEFGLRGLERFGSGGLVATFDGAFDFLDESADAREARTVDGGAVLVAADALAGLRRVGHVCSLLVLWRHARWRVGQSRVATLW